jgi:glycosyltransferase involved in cell wall biosynthesis
LKIVYVITRSDVIGGASVHLMDLASGMQTEGHGVTILVGGNGMLIQKVQEKGLNCIPLKHLVREISPYLDFLCFFELKSKLTDLSPDIVHLHSSKAGLIGRMVTRILGIPNIFTAHGWSFTDGVSNKRRHIYCFLERHIAKFSDKIITVSEYDRQLALTNRVGNPALITTIHNGMPNSELQTTPLIKTSKTRLIMVARFDVPKNQTLLLKSLAYIKDFPWELDLVGDGPNFDEVKSIATSLGLDNYVHFSGSCDDVPMRLKNSDIFLLISNWEGFPLTILEAMRAGLPVIVSDVGGVSVAVSRRDTCFLIPRDDSKSLSDAISTLVSSSELRETMGNAGRLRFEQKFTFEIMLKETLNLYQEVMKN